jgi:UbiD family decarboxylase
MAFYSFRDFVNVLDKAGELKRIAQPVATELETTEIAATENELKEERALVADLLPK